MKLKKAQLPSMQKVEEDRNKVIPNYVMEEVRNAFQKKLSNFFLEAREVVPPQQVEDDSGRNIEKLIGRAAVNIAREVSANCIVTIEKGDSQAQELSLEDVRVVIFRQAKKAYQRISYNTKVKRLQVGSVMPIKELLMEAINHKYVGKGDKLVFVGGESLGSWLRGFFFVFDVDKVFFDISTNHLNENVNSDVLESIINIALEIGTEGREGRSIGTAFIVGPRDELLKHSRPLLKLNPFASLPEASRKITDPEMKETVKNLAQLDGCFLIDDCGTILTAGAYLNIDQDNLDLQGVSGFGTRHRCTAAITKLTPSVGVVVSASGGAVRIFKEGRMVMKLP